MNHIAIYLDLDGVLADYDAGIRALGLEANPLHRTELENTSVVDPTDQAMYDLIEGTEFFAELPLLPGAEKLFVACLEADPIFLTAAPKFGSAEDDYFLNPFWLGAAYHKRRWVERFLDPDLSDDRFICTTSARKWQFLNRKTSPLQVLIDDRFANCLDWDAAGGVAIHHDGDVDKTLEELRMIEASAASQAAKIAFEAAQGGVLAKLSIDALAEAA